VVIISFRVVSDRLMKSAHLVAVQKDLDWIRHAEVFVYQIIRLHKVSVLELCQILTRGSHFQQISQIVPF